MITKEFAEATTELNMILNYLPIEYVEKIPKKLRIFFEEVSSKSYTPKIDINKPLEEQDIMEKTKDLITVIYRKYWCTEEERNKLDEILIENDKKHEKNLREKYNPDNIFKNKDITQEVIKEETGLLIKDNHVWYKKAISFISNLFKKISNK